MSDSGRAIPLKNLWPFAAIFIALFAFYNPIFLTKGAWLVGDHAEQHFPWQWYLAKSLKQGMLPFWTDLIHSGFPLIAEGQIGAFYPPNLFFARFFPIEQGYAWNTVSHLVLSAFFMTAFLKSLGLDNRSTFLGVFVYTFGSTLGGAYYNITCLKVMTWFPLTLILADRITRAEWPVANSILLGVLFTFQLLAGYLQFAVYAMLFTGLYALIRWKQHLHAQTERFITLSVGLSTALALAVLLSLPQLLLTSELAFLSNRAVTTEGFAYVGSYSPLTLACLLFPNFEGFFISKLYLGVLPLFFIFASFTNRRTHAWRAAMLLTALAFLLALGRFSPLYILIVKVLNFHSFRTPVKFIFFAGFFLSVLCALGAQEVFNTANTAALRRSARAFIVFLVTMTAGVLAAYAIFVFLEGPLTHLGERIVRKWIYGTPGHPFGWEHYQVKVRQVIEFGQTVLSPGNPAVLIPLIKMTSAAVFIWGLLRAARLRLFFYFAAIFLLVADLQLSYSDIQGDYASYDSFYRKNQTTEFLERNLGRDQYFNYSSNPSEAPLPQAKNMVLGLRTANGYSPLILKNYYDFFGPLGGINDSIAYQPVQDAALKSRLGLLGLLGIRYLVTDRPVADPRLSEVSREGKWRVLKQTRSAARYRFVDQFEVISDSKKTLTALHHAGFNPSHTVILDKNPGLGPVSKIPQKDTVTVISQSDGSLELEAATTARRILVIGETYYPGWQAWIDGQPAEIMRANLIAKAVVVPAGTHRILLHYDPWHRLKNWRLWRILSRN